MGHYMLSNEISKRVYFGDGVKNREYTFKLQNVFAQGIVKNIALHCSRLN